MKECKNIKTCPIFARFRHQGLKNIWVRHYCKGEMMELCVRKKLRAQGRPVAPDLLPNGDKLSAVA